MTISFRFIFNWVFYSVINKYKKKDVCLKEEEKVGYIKGATRILKFRPFVFLASFFTLAFAATEVSIFSVFVIKWWSSGRNFIFVNAFLTIQSFIIFSLTYSFRTLNPSNMILHSLCLFLLKFLYTELVRLIISKLNIFFF